jgi:hypothetical protein
MFFFILLLRWLLLCAGCAGVYGVFFIPFAAARRLVLSFYRKSLSAEPLHVKLHMKDSGCFNYMSITTLSSPFGV